MKKALFFILSILIITASACGPRGEDTPETTQGTEATTAETGPKDVIAEATETELVNLIESYKAAGDDELVYRAAMRLIELNPGATEAYIEAAAALLRISKSNYDEINRLLEQGAASAEDVVILAEWAENNQPDISLNVPFVSDVTSPEQINAVGATTGNQTNAAKYDGEWRGGLLTWQGDWVYLTRPDEGFAIYKMRADGSGYKRLGEARGASLNIVGDWLYYINIDDYKPCRIRSDGKLAETLTDDGCSFLTVAGDYMFYDNGNDSGCLYQTKIDGSEKIKLSDNTAMFTCVADGWAYYIEKREDSSLYRVPVGGGERNVVIKYGQTDCDYLGSSIRLNNSNPQNFCVTEDWVYYIDLNDRYSVRRVRTDGTGYELVWPFRWEVTSVNCDGENLVCSFGKSYENDNFFLGSVVASIGVERLAEIIGELNNPDSYNDILKPYNINYSEADTEPVCMGPDGWVYYFRYSEGMAWYGMDKDGAEHKIG